MGKTNKIYKEILGILFCPRARTLLDILGNISKGHKNHLERTASPKDESI